MKQSTFIIIISLLIPLFGMSQTKNTFVDDLYFKPSSVKTIDNAQVSDQTQKVQGNQQTQKSKPIPNYKNGAKEIIYKERVNSNTKIIHDTVYVVGQEGDNHAFKNNKDGHDTVYVVGQANDSTESNQEQGYYLNGFNGTESDLEYAERIRHFHNPRYEIFVGDPRYNDINFLNNYDWNVYVDGSYAYVTPTWTNPYWWNYNYSPYSYGNWGFGFNNCYSPFGYSPWGFDNFYGGYGYGGYGFGGYGYGGYGYGGYGYGGYGYGGYGYNNWNGKNGRNLNHDEGTRRDISNNSTNNHAGGTSNSSQSMMIGGGSYNSTNPYTVVNRVGSRKETQNVVSNSSVNRSTKPSDLSTSRVLSTNRNGIGLVRTGGLRNLNSINNTTRNTGSRTVTTYSINTNPRTTSTRNNSTSSNVNSGASRNSYTLTKTNSENYSTSTRTNSSPTISNNNISRSTDNSRSSNISPSNSNNSSSRSSSTYSGGSSSGSSGSSSGSSSGGSRSSGGGGSGSRR